MKIIYALKTFYMISTPLSLLEDNECSAPRSGSFLTEGALVNNYIPSPGLPLFLRIKILFGARIAIMFYLMLCKMHFPLCFKQVNSKGQQKQEKCFQPVDHFETNWKTAWIQPDSRCIYSLFACSNTAKQELMCCLHFCLGD